jgi:hypothetical protein
MLTDRYELPLSTTSSAARDAYVKGCEAKLTMYPGAVEAFDRALAADPGFALAHAATAHVLLERGDAAAARASMAAANSLAAGAIGEQSVVADAVEALGQHVRQEAANELVGWQRHWLIAARPFDPVIRPGSLPAGSSAAHGCDRSDFLYDTSADRIWIRCVHTLLLEG